MEYDFKGAETEKWRTNLFCKIYHAIYTYVKFTPHGNQWRQDIFFVYKKESYATFIFPVSKS